MSKFNKILHKRVVAIKGYRADLRTSIKSISPEFILFEDGETLMELSDQDYYAYRDCDPWAKRIEIITDKEKWQRIMDDDNHYPHATRDLSY